MASRSLSFTPDAASPNGLLPNSHALPRHESRPMGDAFRAAGAPAAVSPSASPLQALRDKLAGAGRLAAATGLALGLVCAPSAKAADPDMAVKPGKAPMILVQPKSQMAPEGGTATLRIEASEAKTFQWHHKANGADNALPTGKDAVLSLSNIQTTHEGAYYCVITNDHGSVTSDEAQIEVVKAADPYDRTNPVFTGQRLGMQVRGFQSKLIDDLMNQMVQESPSFKAAILDLTRQGKGFTVLDGNLPANHLGDTFITTNGDFFVVMDTVKCRQMRESLTKHLAHEIKHILDGSKDHMKFVKEYQHESAKGTYWTNAFERNARAFGEQVLGETSAYGTPKTMAKVIPAHE